MLHEAGPASADPASGAVTDDRFADDPVSIDPLAVDPAAVVAGAPVAARPVRTRRPSSFDRPKQPRDWRWVVAGIGRVLIATGLLMFGFVAYQLWGTALQTAAAQNRLEHDFEERFRSMPTLPPGSVATTPAPSDPAVPGDPTATDIDPTASDPTETSISTDASTPVGSDVTVPEDPTASTTPATPIAPTTPAGGPGTETPGSPAATAPPSPIPLPAPLDVIGRIEIPKIGVDHIVVQGVTRRALMQGPGHFPETPLPGQLGNAAIAGHRTTYGAPFGTIDKMAVGDVITVTVPGAGTYHYVTNRIEIVLPEDYGRVMPGDPNKATLILVSCHPKYTTQKRLIVHATLDASRSNIVTQPSPTAPPDLVGLPDEEVPGTNAPAGTTPVPVESSPPASAVPADTATAAPLPARLLAGGGSKPIVVASVTSATNAPSIPMQDDDDTSAADGEDAFAAGWFDDEAAWPHVAGWGLLLALISLGAYWVSRRARRNWVGALVGIVPFLVALYFFYENVNRLLPPAL